MLFTILFSLVLILFYLYYNEKLNYWTVKGVPNLKPITPLGDLVRIIVDKKNLHLVLRNFYREFKKKGYKYGGFYFTLGPVFVPIDRELIKSILATDHDDHFAERGTYHDKSKIPLSDNLFSSNVERWRYFREMLAGGLTPAKIKMYVPIVENYAKVFGDIIGENEGKPIDIFKLAQRYTLDIACSSYFGVDEENLRKGKSPIIDFASNMNTITFTNLLKVCLTDGVTKPANIFTGLIINKKINTFIYNYALKLYKIRKESKVKRNDLLSIFIQALEDENQDFDFDALVGQIFIIFLATFETNSFALMYVFYQLGKLDDVQVKVRNEIQEAVRKNNGVLNNDTLLELDYLDRVLTESIRVHTIVPTLNRCCIKDYEIPGSDVIIENGTSVLISVLAIHNDPEIFPNPQIFDPNRFLDPDQKQSMMIFGLGKKYCLGKRFGLTIIKRAIAEVVMNYEISVNEKTGTVLEYPVFSTHITWKYKNTLWLDFKRLKDIKSI